MAKIINEENHLCNEIDELRKERKEYVIKSIIYVFVFVLIAREFLGVLGVWGMLYFSVAYRYYGVKAINNDIRKLAIGAIGELELIDILSDLPEEYSIISDLEVKDDEGKTSQIDTVVLGPSGIYIIEVKNMTGTIYGDFNDKELIQSKISEKGNEYSKAFYNPIKQVRTHTYRLARFLKMNNINLNIKNMVVFINDEVNIRINNTSDTFVFSKENNGIKELKKHILSYDDQYIPQDKVIHIENLLSECII